MKKCIFCGNDYTPQQLKDKAPTQNIRHSHNGVILTDTATRYNDAFFEIVKGERRGNLVHIFDVLKSN